MDRITELSAEEHSWLEQATAHILKIMRAKYGLEEFTRSENDLRELQRLIDDHAIAAADVLEAQCVGVVLGNVFVEKMQMRWKRVVNEFGDTLALHDESSHFTYYPLTMISKRLEDKRSIDLVALYEDLAANLQANR